LNLTDLARERLEITFQASVSEFGYVSLLGYPAQLKLETAVHASSQDYLAVTKQQTDIAVTWWR